MQKKIRKAGILLHPTSLAGKYGIGTFGKEAYQFIDFLNQAKFKVWQVLPITAPGYGNSPYQCYSSIAGNPVLIDLENLQQMGFLSVADLIVHQSSFVESSKVNFDLISALKFPLLRKAYNAFRQNSSAFSDFIGFCNYHEGWLNDFALFMALKENQGGKPITEWDPLLRTKNTEAIYAIYDKLIDEVGFQKFIQYIFFRQWMNLKRYANERGIEIMGDIPIYVAADSADVWANPKYFDVDNELKPISVAGVPPDYFSKTGQLWGNPVYRWEEMKSDDFQWWRNRLKGTFAIFDSVRIDHFRGFAQYWAIPAGDKTAENGTWKDAPGISLFESIAQHLGKLEIVAEDLGVITPDVTELRDKFNFPGMKILQFAFDSSENNEYLPHNYTQNSVVYTGTHDNNTSLGWMNDASIDDLNKAINYMNCTQKSFVHSLVRLVLASTANIAIIPMQDLLELNENARMNIPGTPNDNWNWKLTQLNVDSLNSETYKFLNQLYGRG